MRCSEDCERILLGDRLNASGGCETTVTSRVRVGWMKIRECGELLRGRRFITVA